MKNNYEVIIVGGGPAGLTAAIYLKRAGHDVVVFERYVPGGKVNSTAIIDNYPGVPHISGPDFASMLFEQVRSLKIRIEEVDVLEIKKQDEQFVVVGDDGEYISKSVIIASGTREKKLEVKGEEQFFGKGVSYCAICDGPLYKQKDVAVIGAGNSAFEEALYLSSICHKVYIIHRSEAFRGDHVLVNDVRNKENVEIITNAQVKEINGDQVVNEILICKEGKDIRLAVDGVFPFIGTIPNTQFLKKLHILDEASYVIVNNKMESSIEGLFAAGDVISKDIRQIVTATSDGAIAATSASRYLKRR